MKIENQINWRTKATKLAFETRCFIQDDYLDISNGESFITENPVDFSELACFPDGGVAAIDQAVSAARAAFNNTWRIVAPEQRQAYLLAFAAKIEAARDTLALLICLEMGKPIGLAVGEVDGVVSYLRYYADSIDKIYGDVAASDIASTLGISVREPHGVVGIISPWNFPLATAMNAIAPALAIGNTVVVKPSEQAPSAVLKLGELAIEAGLPAGVLNVVLGIGNTSGAALARHTDVDMLHFTGSVNVGRQLMIYAGESNGKPVMLELGGKSPQIVFDDAIDINGLGQALAESAFYNSGQVCLAKTRLLVHASIQDQVINAIEQAGQQCFVAGNPLDTSTTFGPIASRKQYERVNQYLQIAGEEGANPTAIAIDGTLPTTGGYIAPTLLTHANNTMRVTQEEIFGPLLSVIPFKDETEALALANDSPYGLSAAVWTQDLGRARRISRDLQAGEISIYAAAKPAASSMGLSGEPFGASGFGVVGGYRGLEPYSRVKAIQFVTD